MRIHLSLYGAAFLATFLIFGAAMFVRAEGPTGNEVVCSAAGIQAATAQYTCRMPDQASRNAVRDVCKNGNRFTLWIGAGNDSQPSVQFQTLKKDNDTSIPANDREACYVQFCTQHRPSAGSSTGSDKWVCTSEHRYNKNDLPSNLDRPNLIGEFSGNLVEDRANRVTGVPELSTLRQTLPENVAGAVFSAFNEEAGEVRELTEALQTCDGGTVQQCLSGQPNSAQTLEALAARGCGANTDSTTCLTSLTEDNRKLTALAAEAQALGRDVGTVGCTPPQVMGPSGCQNPTGFTDTTSAAARERACIQQGGVMINGQCVRQNPYSGFGNTGNPYGQQQCSGMQQMMSTCRNPYTGQQQCTGLALMTNNCPTGSQNPNGTTNYPPPSCNIQVNPTNVAAAGQAATLQWQSQYAQYAYLSNSGQIGPSGSMTVYPQSPTTYTMTVVGYNNQQAQCQTQVAVGGQGGAGGPQAQISCQPQTLDAGMQVGISFACQNASQSAGSGFSTGGALSGSATSTVPNPPAGQYAVTYGLTCSNQGVTHSAQCTVNVNKTAIVLVANPKNIESGEESNIGWVTSGMNSCVISSPDDQGFTDENADITNTSGSASTGELSATTRYLLTCETKTGITKTASTTVVVGN